MVAANPLTRLAAVALFCAPCLLAAADTPSPNDARRDVDLVIALDVSGSMEGLIESAKQRLWDITNELARARPVPAALSVARAWFRSLSARRETKRAEPGVARWLRAFRLVTALLAQRPDAGAGARRPDAEAEAEASVHSRLPAVARARRATVG